MQAKVKIKKSHVVRMSFHNPCYKLYNGKIQSVHNIHNSSGYHFIILYCDRNTIIYNVLAIMYYANTA